MAERDKTITITSHLHFASSVNILGSCCYAETTAHEAVHTNVKKAGEHVLMIETVMEITHEKYSLI